MPEWDHAAVEAAARAVLHGRYDQAFFSLTADEIARLARFGTRERFRDGEPLFQVGRPRRGMFIVLRGTVALSARDGLGHVTPLVEQGPGQFIGEISTLA